MGLGLGFAQARTSVAVVASLAALCCSAPVGAETVDQLYAMAKAEKTLVVWAAASTAGYERAARAFEQQFPGVTVSLMSGFSNVLNAKIEEQAQDEEGRDRSGDLPDHSGFYRLEQARTVAAFKPESFDKIDAGYKDKDGAWIAVNKNPIFYGYNTENVRLKTCQNRRPIS